jgi:asparagine synthase (glutamine-hydrolysing)
MARAHVKAALSADGGDELFGGYRNYRSLPARAERLRRLPAPLRSLARSLLGEGSLSTVSYLSRCWRRAGPRKIVDRLRKLRQALPGAGDDEVFDLAVCFWTPEEIGPLVGGYAPPRVRSDAYRGRFEERMMLWDLHHYLPDDILAKVDRASMSASLEGREPLLDHRVVEFAFSLPLDQRLGALGSKHILRRILYRRVPRELVLRPKQGFGIPLRQWLLDGLDGLLEEHLSPQAIRAGGFFDPRLVAAGVRDFRRGAGVDAGKVWMLLAFELWRKAWDRRS